MLKLWSSWRLMLSGGLYPVEVSSLTCWTQSSSPLQSSLASRGTSQTYCHYLAELRDSIQEIFYLFIDKVIQLNGPVLYILESYFKRLDTLAMSLLKRCCHSPII